MKTLKNLTLLFIFVLLTQNLFSQNNLVEVQIMTNDGAELNGFINYQQWEISPKSIEFYKTLDAEKSIFTASDTKWFKVGNDFYESKKITFTKSPRNTNNLSYNKTNPQLDDLAFCLIFIKGTPSLFEYTDKWAITHYFIEKGEDEVIELVYYRYFVKQGATKQKAIAENNKYRGQLNYLLLDCPEVQKRTKSVKYESEPLKKLNIDYNNCKGNSIIYSKKEEKSKIIFGVTAGVSFTNVAFSNPDSQWDFLVNSDLKTSINPTFGASMYLIPKRGNGKFTFQLDLLYKSHFFDGEYQDYHNDEYYTNYTFNFGASYLKISTLARYNFVGRKLVPYIAGGVYTAGTINYSNTKVTDKYFYSQHTTKTGYLFEFGIRNYDYGLLAETGINYQRFNLGVRYEVGGVSQANSYTNTFYVLITYLFK